MKKTIYMAALIVTVSLGQTVFAKKGEKTSEAEKSGGQSARETASSNINPFGKPQKINGIRLRIPTGHKNIVDAEMAATFLSTKKTPNCTTRNGQGEIIPLSWTLPLERRLAGGEMVFALNPDPGPCFMALTGVLLRLKTKGPPPPSIYSGSIKEQKEPPVTDISCSPQPPFWCTDTTFPMNGQGEAIINVN